MSDRQDTSFTARSDAAGQADCQLAAPEVVKARQYRWCEDQELMRRLVRRIALYPRLRG